MEIKLTKILKLLDSLEEIANRECRSMDLDYDPRDSSGNNFDDCFSNGISDGYVLCARELLEEYNKED